MPTIHRSASAAEVGPLDSETMTIGIVDRMLPKMGTSENTAAIVASRKANFTLRSSRPTRVSAPLMTQIVSWPRTTPPRPRSMRDSRSESLLRSRIGVIENKKETMRSLSAAMNAVSISTRNVRNTKPTAAVTMR